MGSFQPPVALYRHIFGVSRLASCSHDVRHNTTHWAVEPGEVGLLGRVPRRRRGSSSKTVFGSERRIKALSPSVNHSISLMNMDTSMTHPCSSVSPRHPSLQPISAPAARVSAPHASAEGHRYQRLPLRRARPKPSRNGGCSETHGDERRQVGRMRHEGYDFCGNR